MATWPSKRSASPMLGGPVLPVLCGGHDRLDELNFATVSSINNVIRRREAQPKEGCPESQDGLLRAANRSRIGLKRMRIFLNRPVFGFRHHVPPSNQEAECWRSRRSLQLAQLAHRNSDKKNTRSAGKFCPACVRSGVLSWGSTRRTHMILLHFDLKEIGCLTSTSLPAHRVDIPRHQSPSRANKLCSAAFLPPSGGARP